MAGTSALALTGASMVGLPALENAQQTKASSVQTHQQGLSTISKQQAADTNQRMRELAEVSATHRARTAAQGMNPFEGSSAAVLEGLEGKTLEQLKTQGLKFDQQRSAIQKSFAEVQDEYLGKNNSSSDLLLGGDTLLRDLKNWG